MTTITITLPEELVKQAKEKGLLSSAAIEAYVREKLRATESGCIHEDEKNPPNFDPRLKGAVDPAMYGRGKIHGDIIGPFFGEWGEKP